MENQLRDRVILRTDGGIRAGWDVMMAALMGAEEYGFGTIAMIAECCIMARICHTNNCPVGVASSARNSASGLPVCRACGQLFCFIAEEVMSLFGKAGLPLLERDHWSR